MPIVDHKGRPISVRTSDEERNMLLEDLGRLPAAEQRALIELYDQVQEGGEDGIGLFEGVARVEYDNAPVDVRTFLTDPYFLGETGSALWPKLVDDMVELFEGGYHEAVLGGSLGWGKSFFATTALAYLIYQMSCLRDPQRAYGIAQGSHVYIAMLSVTEKVARRVAVNELIGKIAHSRYFKEKFPPKAAPSLLEIRFPKRIQVVAGSTGSSAIIGLNAFGGLIDETSFMGGDKEIDRQGRVVTVDKGEKIYHSIIRRMKSRFQKVGQLPGLLILASSKERPVAFVEKRITHAREQKDPSFYVREYATWDVKPAEAFTGDTFEIIVGNERYQSRIIGPGDEKIRARCLEMGLRVIEIPEEYRNDFLSDMDTALRDIAGVATLAVSPFIQKYEALYKAFEESGLSLPLGSEGEDDVAKGDWTCNTPLTINWGRIAVQRQRRLPGGYNEDIWVPMRRPESPRYAHLDLAISGDSAGLAIGYIDGWTEVVRRDAEMREYIELAPVIGIDLLLRIKPPPGDEIDLATVRAIVYQFSDHGFNVRFVSCDQFQSADTLQQMRKRGIEAEVVSVDRTTEPYEVMRSCIYEARLRAPNHPHCVRELSQLQRVPRTNGGYKIDHPAIGSDGKPGSKDVADALAGVVHSLTQRAPGQPLPPMMGVSEGQIVEQPDASWVTGGMVQVSAETGSRGGSKGIVGSRPEDPRGAPLTPFLKG